MDAGVPCHVWLLLQTPFEILPRVYLGTAVCADSHHLINHMGITHIINATEVRVPCYHLN